MGEKNSGGWWVRWKTKKIAVLGQGSQTMYGGDGLDDVEVVDYEPDDEDEVIAS